MQLKPFLIGQASLGVAKLIPLKTVSLTIVALLATFALASLVGPGCGGGSGGSSAPSPSDPNVLTYHNDNQRTGQNLHETILNPSNVNETDFGKLFSDAVDGWMSAEPLYVHGVTIGAKQHNVVYVATEHDSVYAFDADQPGPPLWQRSFINPGAGVRTVLNTDLGGPFLCGNLPEMGIVGTPVIDRKTGTLYVVSLTMENDAFVYRLHALSITDGAEKFGGPVVIQASVAGTGYGSNGSQVPFDGGRELQRPALLLENGVVYIGFGSHCDFSPYHGWLFGYDAKTLQQLYVFNSTPDGQGGGIWMGGGGPSTDASGNIYLSTGNGTFDADQGGRDYGDSFLRLHPSSSGLSVVGYFTPYNQNFLDLYDLDLGSADLLILPGQAQNQLLVSGSKNANLFLCNRNNLGGFSPTSNNVVQELSGVVGPIYGTGAYWNGQVYFIGADGVPMEFSFSKGSLSQTPVSQGTVSIPFYGTSPVISADGNQNGILWAVNFNPVNYSVLYAFDASDLSNELYDSTQAGTRDRLSDVDGVPFAIPMVVDGKVYVGTRNTLDVFGLLP